MTVEGWDDERWAGILQRIEHRQAGIGLRFCGPPLWLEVTMSGPDSDAWSTADAGDVPDRQWDWQSSQPCADAMGLAAAGADDDRLLGSASRYTLENLILNAVHEIGEWLRFDAQRVFPAHGGHARRADGSTFAVGDGVQGNGSVSIDFAYGLARRPSERGCGDDERRRRVSERASELAPAWRFTYLPGTSVSYGPHGVEIHEAQIYGSEVNDGDAGDEADRGVTWSSVALDAVAAPAADFVEVVKREVHRAAILHEAARVCEAFHVDGRQPWGLDRPDAGVTAVGPDDDGGGPVTVSVSYAPAPSVPGRARTPVGASDGARAS